MTEPRGRRSWRRTLKQAHRGSGPVRAGGGVKTEIGRVRGMWGKGGGPGDVLLGEEKSPELRLVAGRGGAGHGGGKGGGVTAAAGRGTASPRARW